MGGAGSTGDGGPTACVGGNGISGESPCKGGWREGEVGEKGTHARHTHTHTQLGLLKIEPHTNEPRDVHL